MTLKIAYFAPTVVVAGPVSPVEFSKIFNLAELLHSHPELNDANNVGLSIRGGQQIQVYPNSLNIDVQWLVSWLEESRQSKNFDNATACGKSPIESKPVFSPN